MCLAVPHTIETILGEHRALAAAGAVRTEIRTDLVDDVEPGDTVLVHAGFAIEKTFPGGLGRTESPLGRTAGSRGRSLCPLAPLP